MTVTASGYAREQNDLYQTEPWVTEALLRHFPVAGLTVWEPAAGNHLMADVLEDAGATVVTSDIAIYDRDHDVVGDFLTMIKLWRVGFDAIVTNPPYGPGGHLARHFVERALDFCPGLVAMLLTAKFDSGKTRAHLFRDSRRFWAKIVLLDRVSWTLDGNTGTEDHAWYVWGPRRSKPPTLIYEERPR